MQKTKLKPDEVKALYARFRRLAPSGYLLPDQFKQTLGVIGLTDDPFLPNRLFKVFDTDQDGRLSFFEFASSLAVMIRGTEDEKLQLSFEMCAGGKGAAGISLLDFQQLIRACNTMMSSLVAPSRGLSSDDEIESLFNDLSADDGMGSPVITMETYRLAAQQNEEFLMCLGFDPLTRPGVVRDAKKRTTVLGTKVSVGTPTPCATTPGSAPSATPSPKPKMPVPDQVHLSKAHCEEVRDRIFALRNICLSGLRANQLQLEQRHVAPNWVAHNHDPGERWWTPLGDSPPRDEQGGSWFPEDVNNEFDRLLRICTGGERSSGCSLGTENSPACHVRENTLALPSSSAEEEPAAGLTRRSPTAHSSSFDCTPSCGSRLAPANKVASAVACSGSSFGHKHRASAFHSNVGSNAGRKKRRHRLLGPKKGLAVHFGHENWNMVLSMMIGIRMSVGRSSIETARELQPVDFIMKEKFSIIPRLANIFDSAVSKRVTMTRFIDYAPMVFQKIRASFGIQHEEYLKSVGPEQLLGNMVLGNLSSLSELSSEGKSGAFFYYTADGNYMMKTVAPKEHQLLKSMLKRYHDHIMQHPGTLIVRFLGLHCLRVRKVRKGGASTTRKLYFVVMGNMFNTPYEIHRRYDLKGSWVGRHTPPGAEFDPSVALKDVDFKQANESIRIGEERRQILVAQIQKDSKFLCENNIIDYSLLLGIHDISATTAIVGSPVVEEFEGEDGFVDLDAPSAGDGERAPLHQQHGGGMLSSDKRSLYFMGVIDILTPYDTAKKLEHHFKALRHDRRGVSCCPPGLYAERFTRFISDAFV